VALIIGFFVFWKDSRSLISNILLFIAVGFALWSASDLVIWINPDSSKIMFLWSWINLLEMLISVATLYFSYVFLEEKDVSFKFKLFFGILLATFIMFIPTRLNLVAFNYDNCESVQGLLINYYHILEAFFSVWLLVYLIRKMWTVKKIDERKKAVYLSLGVTSFLFSFSGTNIISSITTRWELLQYGLFGMVVFMGFLAYLIVKFKAFHIKMLGAQALVVAIVSLVGAQYFFTPFTDVTNIILISVTVFAAAVLGIWLVKSVKMEVERKEQLQRMSDSLAFANDKLRVNNTKLEKIDATKTDFINIASHQLHKVPTPIKGYLSLLLEGSYGKISAEQRRVLENINFANNRQISLVDDLLNVSRMESGKIKLDFEKEHLETICQEAYEALAPAAKEKGLKFSWVHPKKALPKLIMDKGKIFEAIFNFVDNAIKYTPKGKVDLQVELDAASHYEKQIGDDDQKEALTGPVVRLTIVDTGAGIAKENIPYLFVKFSRRDTAKLNIEGTGLGLYVVKLMIEAHGGRTWAESEGEGKGSKFIIEIPVEQPEHVSVKK